MSERDEWRAAVDALTEAERCIYDHPDIYADTHGTTAQKRSTGP